jgi:glutamate-ammonia-ligase adenylyltransferase
VKPTLEERLRSALRGTFLAARLSASAGPLLEKWGAEHGFWPPDEQVLQGLARTVATSFDAARFLAHRSKLFERVTALGPDYLTHRVRELEGEIEPSDDLEGFLDRLRLLRREETILVACLDLGEVVPFDEASEFLSRVAETIVGGALAAARRSAGSRWPPISLSVIGLGKIGGREFSYHSDLDLVFLYEGDPDAIDSVSRVVQRLIAYLSTMTGAGIAYAVDTRLRPSGQQGTLVTSFDSFERYQRQKAEAWEHLALVRARPIAGDVVQAQGVLDRVRSAILASDSSPWDYIAEMRERVERERAREGAGAIDLKTGPGGLMDIEFLAEGGVLESGPRVAMPSRPSIPALLRSLVPGQRVEQLLEHYRFLRRVEARARWLAGRATDRIDRHDESFALLAELVEPGMGHAGLFEQLAEARHAVRGSFRAVVEAGSIAALAG